MSLCSPLSYALICLLCALFPLCVLCFVIRPQLILFVSRHIFLRKATLLTEKKNNSLPPPPPKKNPNTLTQHLVTGTQKYRLLFFLAGIIHISVTVQAKSVTKCGSQVRICFCPRVRKRTPSQSILGTQDVQTGTSMKPLPQQGGDWHCHMHLKQTSGKPRLLTITVVDGVHDHVRLRSNFAAQLQWSIFFFFFFEFPPKATRAGDEKQRNKKTVA